MVWAVRLLDVAIKTTRFTGLESLVAKINFYFSLPSNKGRGHGMGCDVLGYFCSCVFKVSVRARPLEGFPDFLFLTFRFIAWNAWFGFEHFRWDLGSCYLPCEVEHNSSFLLLKN